MDLFSIEGKTALVTGGSRGIGLMISTGFVEAGATVYVSSRNADACAEAVAALNERGPGSAVALPADLSVFEESDRVAAELGSQLDRLDILVNNAGSNWGEDYETFSEKAWDRCLDLNLKGTFALTRALTPLLAAAASDEDPARVINIGSIDGLRVPEMETYSYSTSKAAVHHLTKVLARKLAPKRITVNAVAPGPFESKMMAATLDAFGDMIRATCPLGRIGEPSDMAGIAIFLSSRAGAYLTGTVIPVDGGISTTR
jgi:NAD(P)-dependent dehydrogenase (short-subunit alcohol dehydrogenase family)